ncbi:hypothetical protein Tco_1159244 [Tanacetum coccineum]
MLRRSRIWLRMNLISSRRCSGNGGRGGSMTGRGGGWLAKRSIVSNKGCGDGGFVVRGGEFCLEGCDGARWRRSKWCRSCFGGVLRRSGRFPVVSDGKRGWRVMSLDG